MAQDLSFLNDSHINIREDHVIFHNPTGEIQDNDESNTDDEEDRTTDNSSSQQTELEQIMSQPAQDQDNQDNSAYE